MTTHIGKPGIDEFLYQGNNIGVFMIHGYSASPYQMRGIAKYLNDLGFTCYCIRLPGHGETPRHLEKVSWKEILGVADKKLTEFKEKVDKVYLLGACVGGNIAIKLAEKHKVHGIIAVATPIFLRYDKIIKYLSPIVKYIKPFIKKRRDSYEAEYLIRHGLIYDVFPIRCVPNVLKLMSLSKKALPYITAPILVMQSTNDYIINPKSALYIYQESGSLIKKISIYDNKHHIILYYNNNDDVYKPIYDFIYENELKDYEKLKVNLDLT